MARILDGGNPEHLHEAALALRDGRLVAFPTETVYGLGANAGDDAAVAAVFSAKGRPADHPLIVHVAHAEAAAALASDIPPVARRLMDAFWPGPLTVIVPRREGVRHRGGGRACHHRPALPGPPGRARAAAKPAPAKACIGLAAPSANLFGRISPTTARHVADEFDEEVWVLDGGPCRVGIESTIVDCSRGRPVLLRPGVLTPAQIEEAIGEPLLERDDAAPRASGTLEAHYAPRAKLRLMDAEMLRSALQVLGDAPVKLALYSRTVRPPRGVIHRSMPGDATQAAQELFAVLRELDALGVQLIWVESPPPAPEWDGVRDRLMRAAAS